MLRIWNNTTQRRIFPEKGLPYNLFTINSPTGCAARFAVIPYPEVSKGYLNKGYEHAPNECSIAVVDIVHSKRNKMRQCRCRNTVDAADFFDLLLSCGSKSKISIEFAPYAMTPTDRNKFNSSPPLWGYDAQKTTYTTVVTWILWTKEHVFGLPPSLLADVVIDVDLYSNKLSYRVRDMPTDDSVLPSGLFPRLWYWEVCARHGSRLGYSRYLPPPPGGYPGEFWHVRVLDGFVDILDMVSELLHVW